jgi:hypothetical protein
MERVSGNMFWYVVGMGLRVAEEGQPDLFISYVSGAFPADPEKVELNSQQHVETYSYRDWL